MSVEVLVPKPGPTLTAPPAKMKEQLRPSTHHSGRSLKSSSAHPHQTHHGHQSHHGHHQPSPQRLQSSASADNVRSTPDTTTNSTDIHQHFDHNHIIYDNTTDTTYLRGRLLGKGGFARCYEILNLNSNKVYAGKIISKTRIAKPHQKQKILREVQLQRNLKHRHVVEFNSYFEDDSNVYIILENCSRKSLVHVLKHRKCLTEPEVRYYLRQLVDGTDYVHANQIIHRDLKLGNMLLNEEMDMKIADFGLATRVDFAGEKKMTVCGTPNYIAPEVLQKKGHSFEADIWALGCVAYAMLVGRPPFETTTLKETYLRITENQYTLPHTLSSSAKSLIQKCLCPDPVNRPTLSEILAHEFFTCGYLPPVLQPSCCTSAPKFPSSVQRYTGSGGSSRPMSYAVPNEPKTDPMGRLGNALSQMHLDSRSENLLEEKELEDIEKKSPRYSPTQTNTHTTHNGDCGPSTKEAIQTNGVSPSPTIVMATTNNNDGSTGDRSRSPPQREKSPKPRSAARLLEVLTSCLDQIPKHQKGNPTPTNSEVIWVPKWVDYSNKYGFGFQLSSDALGVLFNDTSRIILAPDGRAIQYYDVTGKLSAYTSDCVPEELERKTILLHYFARYMDEHLIHGGDLEHSSCSDPGYWSGSLYLKKWFRTAKAIVLYLSDGTLQVNFFDDHTKLILSTNKSEYLVTFIDQERSARTFNLCHFLKDGCSTDIRERMTFAKTMLKNLVDIEGADI